jgi:hypothetical protein
MSDVMDETYYGDYDEQETKSKLSSAFEQLIDYIKQRKEAKKSQLGSTI